MPLVYSQRAHKEGDEVVFDVAISSETVTVERYFGTEVLLHGKRNVDLSRLKEVAGVLMNHDANQLVGAIIDPRVDDDRVLRIGVRFDPTEAGQNARKQMENGSLRGASLQYAYGPTDFREVLPGKTTRVNGREIAGPARIVKRWMVIEPTLTPVPADASVGAGRKASGQSATKARRSQIMYRWKAVSGDGSQIMQFRTRKDAEAWVDEQDSDSEFEVLKIEKPADDAKRQADAAPALNDKDLAAMKRDHGNDFASRCTQLLDAAEVAGETTFARELIRTGGGDLDLADGLRQIHERWSESQCKDRKPPKRVEPKDKKRNLTDLDDDAVKANLLRRDFVSYEGHLTGGVLRAADWRSLVENAGCGLQERINGMFESGAIKPRDISFRSLYSAFGRDVPCTEFVRDDITGDLRAVQSTAFNVIAGSTVIAAVRAGYEAVDNIGDQLTNGYTSEARTDTIPAILTEQSMKEVAEGGPYLEGSATEEFHTIGSKKQGRILSLTREMISRDQTGAFMTSANNLGRKAMQAIEKLILERISDVNTSVYKPEGVATALYSTTPKARGTNKVATNTLVDETDLDAARALLAGMTDNEGDPIMARPMILLVPDALLKVAMKILGSEMKPGVENELNNWGPRGRFQPTLLSSPVLDQITAPVGTTTWYLGDFAEQFWKKTAFGIETTMQGRESDAWITRDVAMKFRVAFDVEVGAIDYVHVIQNTV